MLARFTLFLAAAMASTALAGHGPSRHVARQSFGCQPHVGAGKKVTITSRGSWNHTWAPGQFDGTKLDNSPGWSSVLLDNTDNKAKYWNLYNAHGGDTDGMFKIASVVDPKKCITGDYDKATGTPLVTSSYSCNDHVSALLVSCTTCDLEGASTDCSFFMYNDRSCMTLKNGRLVHQDCSLSGYFGRVGPHIGSALAAEPPQPQLFDIQYC